MLEKEDPPKEKDFIYLLPHIFTVWKYTRVCGISGTGGFKITTELSDGQRV